MITIEMVKELRSKTGAGVMVCKKLLNDTNGDMNKALDILKKQEALLAAKKSTRATSEGLIGIHISDDKKIGALVEINCETDFVASNKDFANLTNRIAQQITLTPSQDLESLLQERFVNGDGSSIRDAITSSIARFGENIILNRFVRLSTKSGALYSYIHNGSKIGVLVELTCKRTGSSIESIAKEIALQIAATNPLFLNRDSVDQTFIRQEMDSYENQALSEEKPAPVIEKIVAGKISKFYRNNCLLEQTWIKSEDTTISEFLKESSNRIDAHIEVAGFERFELGTAIRDTAHVQA
jgi:elongation factor Ts